MTRKRLNPVHIAVPTAFYDDETLNADGTLAHIRHLIARGAKSLMLCGSTGEQHSLDFAEKLALLAALEAANLPDDVEIIFGVAAIRQSHAIELAKAIAQSEVVDAILLGFPPYLRPTQNQALAYAEAILQTAQKPCIVYNNPERTGFDLSVESAVQLANNPYLIGFKDPSDLAKLRAKIGDDWHYFCGGDMDIAEKLQQGYNGVSSQLGNLYPDLLQNYVAELLAGEMPSENLDHKVQDFYRGSWLVRLKQQLGMGICRSPLLDLVADRVE
ncbi:MAG: dihydrodipicolinate synthase family protein [Neisseria sp.]|nr:dihydrodipicolinate synthase family protein [Neisseria sp.]